MITKMRISSLKSIHDLELNFSNLNIFAGTNSSGKSTCLQALLLSEQNKSTPVGLNGPYVSLGDFRECRNHHTSTSPIEISTWTAENDEPVLKIVFSENRDTQQYNTDISIDYPFTPFAGKLHYISCHRIGVMDIYQKNMTNSTQFGFDGEYALSFLYDHNEDVLDERICVADPSFTNTLFDQVNYWLKYIIGTELQLRDLQKTNYLQVKYNNNPANSSQDHLYCRPANIGSGISYLISIIIACLGSNSNDRIIIENPEIHLHPKAQSRLSEFFYFISQSSRQLFIETHSDHIFNGIRVGVATGAYNQDLIRVNFLTLSTQTYETQCNPISFGLYGKIKGMNEELCLDDLFDQFEIDIDRMLGI